MATPERAIIETLFKIPDKAGNDVDFKLNREQALLDARLTGRDRVPKARQLGISSYVLARFTARCLYRKNTRAVVISHDKESTQRMLARVHYFLDNVKGPAATKKLANRNEISFPKTNSMFYIGTAGARKFGRGDTITNLHCSEIAFWPDPKTLVAGLYQAVPRSGEILEESTGNGVGNYYHRGCVQSYEGKSRFRLHFFNWLQFQEYRVPLNAEQKKELGNHLRDDWEEPHLVQELGLNLEQIAWRREKLEELDYDLRLFKQEYPITLDECFQATGYSLFPLVNYVPEVSWTRVDPNLWIRTDELPVIRHYKYAIGADVAAGVGRDRSVATIINLNLNKQVGEYVSDSVAPDNFAHKLRYIGEMFGGAFITVESNNHGGMTLLELKKEYNESLLYSHDQDTDKVLEYGYRTTSKTKPLLINNLRHEFTEGFTICSPALKDELATFVETSEGKLEAEAGCFDDRVMATAVCLMGARKAHLRDIAVARSIMGSAVPDPFSLDGILKEFGRRGPGRFPIPAQHKVA